MPATPGDVVTRDLPPLQLRAAVRPGSVDPEKRTAEVVWTTGARVLRGFWEPYWEELSLDPKHVRMQRLNNGAPLLAAHDGMRLGAVLGVVESAKLQKNKGTAVVRFAKAEDDPEAEKVFRKVQDGILQNISVGYRVHRLEKVEESDDKRPVMRATDWEPYELSVVPMGADDGAGFRASDDKTLNPCEFITHPKERTMPENAADTSPSPEVVAERERVTRIATLVKRHALGDAFGEDLVRRGVPLDQARAAILERLVTRDEQFPTDAHISVGESRAGDEAERRIALMSEGLVARLTGAKVSEQAKPYARLRLRDMAKDLLELRGVGTRFLSPAEIFTRAGYLTTSDFPHLLTESGNRMLRDAYQAAPAGVRSIARESSAPDFRAKSKLMLGEAPALEKVVEHGEFKRGTMAEGIESYALATYGKIFGISRQALINDDLSAFADMTVRLGRAAAEFVAAQLVSLLYGAAGVGPTMHDTKAVFHTDHANLGTGGAISDTTLTEALKLMRLQKGLDGATPINATPKYLLIPAALEVIAKKWTRAFNAAKATDINPFAGELEVVVDPRLDAKSATRWWLAADPSSIDTLEYSFLDGEPGPTFEVRMGFDVDGVETKVRVDFGCGVLDHRGLVTNAGA